MTKTEFSKLLHDTDERYQKCWAILASLKSKPNESLQQFQTLLCEALFCLSDAYRSISQKRKILISRKDKLSLPWFSKRQKLLASRQDSIGKAVAIGKTLGDSFVWLFYRNDLVLLEEHLKHCENNHMPPGFGGLGEKEFVKQVPRIGNYFLLYHGTTSILRLGDVSLIDVKSFRVVGIGELKTTPKQPGELSISLLIMGNKELFQNESVLKIPSSTKTSRSPFPPSMQARLDRQMARNANALSSTSKIKEGSKIDIRLETYIPEFEKMVKAARTGHFSYQQFGPGLLCVVLKQKKRSLCSALSPAKKISFSSRLDGLTNHALNLVLPESPYNTIDVGSLIYTRDGATRFQLGTLPVFWWPLPIDVIKKLIFQEYLVFTIYNPAHFISKLQAAGFSVTFNDDERFSVNYLLGDKRYSFTGLRYFLGLIFAHFYKEEEIIDMLNRSISAIDDAKLVSNTKCEFRFHQQPCF